MAGAVILDMLFFNNLIRYNFVYALSLKDDGISATREIYDGRGRRRHFSGLMVGETLFERPRIETRERGVNWVGGFTFGCIRSEIHTDKSRG